MTRLLKIQKLTRAVKDYRGISSPLVAGQKVEWRHAPKKAEVARVKSWLVRLGVPVEETVEKIDKMKTWDEFYKWVDGI